MDWAHWLTKTATRKWDVWQPNVYLWEQCDTKVHDVSAEDNQKNDKGVEDDHPSTHQRFWVCEECEESLSDVFWEDWEQFMCSDCNKKIHNKGKRAKHRREVKFTLDSFMSMKYHDWTITTEDLWQTHDITENDIKCINEDPRNSLEIKNSKQMRNSKPIPFNCLTW